MISDETKHYNRIDTLIRQNCSFAIWRVPGKEVQFIMQTNGTASLYHHLDELKNEQGFIIAPFQTGDKRPIVLIKPDVTQLSDVMTSLFSSDSAEEADRPLVTNDAEAFIHYQDTFGSFMKALHRHDFEKLVLSRSRTVDKPEGFSAGKAFFSAVSQYANSFVYLCHTPQTGTWMGCTPEIILSGEQGAWRTVALAGTQQLFDDRLPECWDIKNREEQRLVAGYIRSQLEESGIKPTESLPYSIRAGALSHLKSDFSFTLPPDLSPGALLQALHPTPAVCGLPKAKSFQFILNNEGHDRQYYSGIIGWLNPLKQSDLYVNLRCLRIYTDRLTLFAGGGLLPSSELESEWQETEAKMQTITHVCLPEYSFQNTEML